jgi:Xaa-Pro aminopeptidase
MTVARIQRLREKLDELKLDGFFVGAPVEDIFHTHGANRRYLSGFTGSMGWLLISRDNAFIAVDFRYVEQAERECPGYTVSPTVGAVDRWFPALVGEAALTGKRIGFEPGDLAVSTFQALKKGIESMAEGDRPSLLASPSVISDLRAIKDTDEIAKLQRAVDIGDAAFQHVAERIEPGWTELQIAWEIEKHARENGAEHMSFPTIVASGPHGAMPHAMPRDHRVEAGDGIVIDMGVIFEGYCSDLTRTVFVGKPDAKFTEIYDIVLTAQRTAEELIKSGISGEEAHNYAHAVIAEAGYGENFGHGLGHGVGLLIHEAPRVAKASKDVLVDGMVLTVEPGIYLTGWGGVRIEDQCVLQGGKLRIMSNAPKLID